MVPGSCFGRTAGFGATLESMPDPASPDPPPSSAGPQAKDLSPSLWCPICAQAISDPLVCGDCSAVLCRTCGTPLESADELAFG